MAREFPASNRLAGFLAMPNFVGVLLPAAVVALGAAARLALGSAIARRVGDLRWVFLMILVGEELLAVLLTGRVAFHYMIQALPAACLVVGAGLAHVDPSPPAAPRWMAITAGAILVFQLASGYVLYLARPWALVPDYDAVVQLSAWIRAHTRPGDPIFVAETNKREAIFYYADRPPASRYIYFEHAVAAYTRGRYLDEIRASLAQSPPRLLVIDVGHYWYDPTNKIDRPLARLIETNYVFVTGLEAGGVRWHIYRPREVSR